MKPTEKEFLCFVAETLGVSPDDVAMNTDRSSLAAWDSMAHLRLIMESQAEYGVTILLSDFAVINSVQDLYDRIK